MKNVQFYIGLFLLALCGFFQKIRLSDAFSEYQTYTGWLYFIALSIGAALVIFSKKAKAMGFVNRWALMIVVISVSFLITSALIKYNVI